STSSHGAVWLRSWLSTRARGRWWPSRAASGSAPTSTTASGAGRPRSWPTRCASWTGPSARMATRSGRGMAMTASRSEAVRLVEAAPDMYEALTGDQDAPESLRPIQWAWGLLQDYEEMLRRHES